MKILIDMPREAAGCAALEAIAGLDVRYVESDPGSESWREQPVSLIRDREVLFCMLPPTNVADMTALKMIQIGSAGYAQLFNLGIGERGVRACNAAGVHSVAIAEWSIAMMINLKRDMRQLIRNQEAAVWERHARFQQEIRGATLGIWGYGAIGRESARQAKALGLKVHVMARGPVGPARDAYRVEGTGDPEGALPDRVFQPEQKVDFLSGLDFLLLSMPLTDATRGIVGEAELKLLPPSCYLLNPARGPLVSEEALLKALRDGTIAGAALDTHYHYPMPPDHPLWGMPNVIMTPHISGSTLGNCYRERVWDLFIKNVSRFMAGEPLLNELTAARLRGE
ncbi:MAG: D-2-hydroxyacid dehydrogenase [Kiritimatiellae bacterium]|nr:D-2-hydroxyacid dehydrogenase [Kiritimatiellia bacterium]